MSTITYLKKCAIYLDMNYLVNFTSIFIILNVPFRIFFVLQDYSGILHQNLKLHMYGFYCVSRITKTFRHFDETTLFRMMF